MKVIGPPQLRGDAEIEFLCAGQRARRILVIDLSRVEWITPLGVVAVLASALSAQQRGLAVEVRLPTNRIARTYLDRIGFYAELRLQGWGADGDLALDEGYEVQACMPVSSVQTAYEVERAVERLEDTLKDVPVVESLFSKVLTVAMELTQNAREHGSPCYMVVQTHTGRTSGTPGVHVAVADFGGGFRETLREVLRKPDDASTILGAFADRVTGTGLQDRGFGLGYVKDSIDSHPNATLTIVSRQAAVTRENRMFSSVDGRLDFRGTVATAYFPYTPPVP